MPPRMNADEQKMLLIRTVKSFPCLYEARYRSKGWAEEKHRAWYKISKELDTPVLDCQRMWVNLRTVYVTLYRKSEEPNYPNSPCEIRWPFYSLMSFVKPQLKKKKISSANKPQGTGTDEEEATPSAFSDDSMDLEIAQENDKSISATECKLDFENFCFDAKIKQEKIESLNVPEFVQSSKCGEDNLDSARDPEMSRAVPYTSSNSEKTDPGKGLSAAENDENAKPLTPAGSASSEPGSSADHVFYYCMSLVDRLRRLNPSRMSRARLAIEQILFQIEGDSLL